MKLFLFLTMICFFGFAFGQLDKTKLDQYFDLLEENKKFNGSVALSENGQILYERSLGFTDFETQMKNNADTKFRIGSISKTFTAVLIMKAVDEGKMDIYKTIDYFFPDLKNGKKITTEMLLNHHSGIHSFTSDPSFLSWHTQPKTEKELVDLINSYEPDFEPNSNAEYSNSNYVLLTFILEKIYGKSYGEILDEKITKPLGLKNTKLGSKINLNNNEANSYKFQMIYTKEKETDMSIPLGAGAIVSTPTDIIRFGEGLISGKIISEKSLKEMRKMKDGFGYGIFELELFGKNALGHNGGIDGFTSLWSYFDEAKISIAITSNGNTWDNNLILSTLLNAALHQPFDMPNFTTISVSEEDLKPLIGTYSNSQIGMEIAITQNDGKLYAQATGQGAFPLDAYSKKDFRFEMAGIQMIFSDDNQSLTLKQGGGEFIFTRK